MKRIIFLITILAAGSFSVAAQGNDQSAGDYFRKGLTFLRQQQYAEALDAFEMSERLDSNRAETSANIGAAYVGLKKPTEAIKAFQRAIDLKPSEATFRKAICKAYATQKVFDKAISACKEGTRLAPESADAAETLLEVMNLARMPAEQIKQQIDLALAVSGCSGYSPGSGKLL